MRHYEGELALDAPLTEEQRAYLVRFGRTRRVSRDAVLAQGLPDAARELVGLPVGTGGAYFTGGLGFMGQDKDRSVTDFNRPPGGQPNLWCDLEPNEAGTTLRVAEDPWDDFDLNGWVRYVAEHFLRPWGRQVVSGSIEAREQVWETVGTVCAEDLS